MTAEQQLERSVLEGKERDELSAIAQAMSLKTTSRTKKADIIDQILDATGVTSGPARRQATAMPSTARPTAPSRPAAPGPRPPPGRHRRRPSGVAGDADAGGPAPTTAADAPAAEAAPAATTTDRGGDHRRLRTGRVRRAARAGRRRRPRAPPERAGPGPRTSSGSRRRQPQPPEPGQPEPGQPEPGRDGDVGQPAQPPAPRPRPAARAASCRAAARSSPTRASWSR